MPESENSPYVLGLDLGVQSVGWAVIDPDEQDRPCKIRATGVRCFGSGVGSEREIEMGRDESGSANRRECRQHRRQLWRRARRQKALFRLLQESGLLPSGPAQTPQQRHSLLLDLDAHLMAEHGKASDRIARHVLPYRLRAEALDKALSPHALGRALYHLGQRRGFLSNRKAKKDSEEEGVVKAGIVELYESMTQASSRTVGEYFAGLDPEEERIRGRWTARKMYLDEFEAIWSAQVPHHEVLTDQLKSRIHRVIFRQRPLKSQKGLIGKCSLERGQRRTLMASLDAQRFRYWQKINDLEITDPYGEIHELTDQQRATLEGAFEKREEITFAGIRKLLGLKKPRGAENNYFLNLEAGGEKRLIGNRTAARMSKVLGKQWAEMGELVSCF